MTAYRTVVFFLIGLFFSACKEETLFISLPSSITGITFKNQLTDSEKENILSYEYYYNGGGVGVGDFNNDGLEDIYFTANQQENKLYLNKGNLKFEDITIRANLQGKKNGWATGVSVVDINADGFLDIYVSYSGLKPDSLRKNELFINKGDLTFVEEADAYGLADFGYSTQATFFDFDLDGDLDCFILNHNLADYERKEAHVMRNAYDYNAGDKLLENTIKNGKTVFVDISEKAGIKGNPLGFGLGLSISDLNMDGYPDIYITNDFVEDDYLYINQGNGTFKDLLRSHLTQTSYSAMGVDIGDLNNDLLPDIISLDMLPEDNERQKLLVWPDNWNVYKSQLNHGFWHQNMRNVLQINNGDSTFSELGQFSGISNTDWSWGVLIADFDLDSYKDIFISNGLRKDFTNIDFIKNFDEAKNKGITYLDFIRDMPSSQTKNYIFKNNANLKFKNKQKEWGFNETSISNGAIYADLDNDGDLEIITNNINEEAKIYKNNLQEFSPKKYLKIGFTGNRNNPNGIGAKVIVNNTQYLENTISHGFQSSFVSPLLVGTATNEVKVEVRWPSGMVQTLKTKANTSIVLKEKEAQKIEKDTKNGNTYFSKVNSEINALQVNKDINCFNYQVLLPNQYSYFGPKFTLGDLNRDNKNDLILTGTVLSKAQVFYNKNDSLITGLNTSFKPENNQNILLADFNGDGFNDLYFVNGTYASKQPDFQNDDLYFGDKNNSFKTIKSIPDQINAQAAEVIDIENDGDFDILIAGNIKPLNYPESEESFLLVNNGNGDFKKVSLGPLGMVTGSQTLDFNKDGLMDIILVGEWMPPVLLINKNGRFEKQEISLFKNLHGWWNVIKKADLDGDGDFDFVLGNIGENTQFKATKKEPASLTFSDFDSSGSIDFFMSYYINGVSYPAYSRDEIAEQIPALRKVFPTYTSYANATIKDFFGDEKLKQASELKINESYSLILENKSGHFVIHQLPIEAQYSPIYAIEFADINNDGKTDIITGGNNDKFRLRLGKVAANYGQLYLNKGAFNFEYVPQVISGLQVKGNVRDIKKVGDKLFFAVNNEEIQTYKLNKNPKVE